MNNKQLTLELSELRDHTALGNVFWRVVLRCTIRFGCERKKFQIS